jgi:hypothetical protein
VTAARHKQVPSWRGALSIDRGTTLEALIRSGALRLVMGNIPDTEIERLLSGSPVKVQAKSRPASRK